jgi:hypothetical protein
MNLEEIQSMWAKDSVIDDVLLDEASIKIPQLHSKYITLHSEFTLLLKKAKQEHNKIIHLRTLYYSGRGTPEMYEETPFDFKLIRSEVPSWVAVDETVNKVEMKVVLYETTLNTLSEILKQIHQLSFNIKNMIAWRQFVNGN